MQIDWLKILKQEVERAGSKAAVARELGYSRPAISLALKGDYPGGIGKLKAKVIATYCERIICIHTKETMSQEACKKLRAIALPQSNPTQLKHWATCQICPNNPNFIKEKAI